MVMTEKGLELSGNALRYILGMKKELLNWKCYSQCKGCSFKIDGEYCMLENLNDVHGCLIEQIKINLSKLFKAVIV